MPGFNTPANRQSQTDGFLIIFGSALRYIYQHIATILSSYDGSLPLTYFLKNYYKQHPKLGSRDRKLLSEMSYCWYRAERSIDSSLSFEERIHATLFLCAANHKIANLVLPEALKLNDTQTRPQKLNILNTFYKIPPKTKADAEYKHFLTGNSVFHFQNIWQHPNGFSKGIDKYEWLQTMLSQPRMFIRIRRNKEAILSTLSRNAIQYQELENNCISLPNGTAIDKLLPEADYAVQDASSQKTGNYFQLQPKNNWWDCCSGAGGKSLLLCDKFPEIRLTVSDTRSTILHNLAQRFRLYNLPMPKQVQLDMSSKKDVAEKMGTRKFNAIICDVPCTGSGTWARTPEQLYFFNPEKLKDISKLQKEIAMNAVSHLDIHGTLYYITCSVFKEENEDVVAYLLKYKHSLELKEMHLINGSDIAADSMFIAVLQRRTTASSGE